jgi:hypothetical protein
MVSSIFIQLQIVIETSNYLLNNKYEFLNNAMEVVSKSEAISIYNREIRRLKKQFITLIVKLLRMNCIIVVSFVKS